MGSLSWSAHGLFLFLSVQAVEGRPVPKAIKPIIKETALLFSCHHHHHPCHRSLFSLSACAEDRGLCPWMNAQNIAEYFTHGGITASADFAVGG
jgi:hypothetical protein